MNQLAGKSTAKVIPFKGSTMEVFVSSDTPKDKYIQIITDVLGTPIEQIKV